MLTNLGLRCVENLYIACPCCETVKATNITSPFSFPNRNEFSGYAIAAPDETTAITFYKTIAGKAAYTTYNYKFNTFLGETATMTLNLVPNDTSTVNLSLNHSISTIPYIIIDSRTSTPITPVNYLPESNDNILIYLVYQSF
jgi:hypothetical protein